MGLIPVDLPWGRTEVLEGTTVGEVISAGPVEGREIVAACVNQRLVGLDFDVEVPCTVEPVDVDSSEGEEVVRRTAQLLFHAVARKHYPATRLSVGQSLRGGYHYTVQGEHPPLEEMAATLTEAFQREAVAGRQVVRQDVSLDAARVLFAGSEPVKERLLRVWPHPRVPLVSCLGFTDIRHGPYALSTRCVRGFHVEPYASGLILVFSERPAAKENGSPAGSVLFRAYSETRRWNEQIGVATIADLNERCLTDDVKRVIQVAEGQHEKKIAEIADRIAQRRDQIRVVFVAGPSSSGKTTFAKRLSIQLEVNGILPKTLSLDDYYVDREQTPRGPDGDYDFEAVEAIDLPLFAEQLEGLVAGEEVLTPVYDFKSGRRRPPADWRPRQLEKDEVLLIEGIHALNPRLSARIPQPSRFRVFVSALTQLCIDDHNRIRTSDTRLLRRIVRDRRYRGHGAAATILRWPSVRAGEEKHIFPFQEQCDAMFNSALAYETSVLRNLAQRFLLEIPADSPAHAKGFQLLRFLDLFVPVWPDHVPGLSIIREFIGDSDFSYK